MVENTPKAEEWWESYVRNFKVTIGATAVLAWGAFIFFHFAVYNSGFANIVPSATAFVCGGACLFVLYKWPSGGMQTGLLSFFVLFCFTFIGIFGDNEAVSQLLTFDHATFISRARERWEVVALLSTAFMALLYFDGMSETRKAFREAGKGQYILYTGGLLVLSVVAIVAAILALHDTMMHFAFVGIVALFFLLVDFLVWQTLEKGKNPQKHKQLIADAKALCVGLDLPVFVALIVLAFYAYTAGIDGCPPSVPTNGLEGLITINATDLSCIEMYPFLAGALAFQMISFNTFYVLFVLGYDKKIKNVARMKS